ncbi:hypothetical protein HOG21_07680, partial [bacterium]|nr:hypothetical protein [bacterium]
GANATISNNQITIPLVDLISVGSHTFNIVVTSSTGHSAEITSSFLVNADEPTPIDNTSPIISDNYVYDITETTANFSFISNEDLS